MRVCSSEEAGRAAWSLHINSAANDGELSDVYALYVPPGGCPVAVSLF